MPLWKSLSINTIKCSKKKRSRKTGRKRSSWRFGKTLKWNKKWTSKWAFNIFASKWRTTHLAEQLSTKSNHNKSCNNKIHELQAKKSTSLNKKSNPWMRYKKEKISNHRNNHASKIYFHGYDSRWNSWASLHVLESKSRLAVSEASNNRSMIKTTWILMKHFQQSLRTWSRTTALQVSSNLRTTSLSPRRTRASLVGTKTRVTFKKRIKGKFASIPL